MSRNTSWRAAMAAEWQESATVLQIILGFIGTVGFLASLYFTYRATNAAITANAVAREIGEAQTRAYLSVKPFQRMRSSRGIEVFLKKYWSVPCKERQVHSCH